MRVLSLLSLLSLLLLHQASAQLPDPTVNAAPACTSIKGKTDCKKQKGCSWFGTACCKVKGKGKKCSVHYNDGGCQASDFCSFNCETNCKANKANGCAWDGKKCISINLPSYEYTTGTVDQTAGVLMYSPTKTISADSGLKGFDSLCRENTPAACAAGYFPIAMICSSERDMTDLPKLLSTTPTKMIYGPNGNPIGTLDSLLYGSQTLKGSASDAGVSITGNVYWSGCNTEGVKDTTVDLTCANWSTNTPNKEGVCGSNSKTSVGDFHFWHSYGCDTKRPLICLCPRAYKR